MNISQTSLQSMEREHGREERGKIGGLQVQDSIEVQSLRFPGPQAAASKWQSPLKQVFFQRVHDCD